MKQSAAMMVNIPSNMVLHKHVYGLYTRFATMKGPLVKTRLEKLIGLIKRGTYQASSEDIRCAYEPLPYLWPYIDPDIESSDDGASDEGIKEQENPYNQEQEEVVLVPRRNPRRLRRGDQISLSQIKSDI